MPGWISDIVGDVADSTVGGALLALLKLLGSWTKGLMDFVSSWWLGLNPAPVGPGSGAAAAQEHTQGFISIVGVICTVIALVRIAKNRGAGPDTTTLAEGLLRVTVISAVGLTGYELLSKFSSTASPWLFKGISGQGDDYKISSLMDFNSLSDANLETWSVGAILILLPVVLIASLVQSLLAMGTDLFGGILVALMPLTAAASVISGGKQAFNKQLSWVLSCVLFKPAAAVALGVGVRLAKGGNMIAGAPDTAGPFVGTIQTFICVLLGCFALPALLKLFAPVGSMMGSNAGSGFVAAAGGAAAGASFSNSSGVSSSSGTSNTVDSSSSSSPSGAGDAGSTMESATSSVADTGKKAAGAAVTAGAAAATGGAAGAGAAGAAGSGAGAGAGAAGSGAGSAAAGGEAATSAAGAAESSGAGAKTAAGQSGSEAGQASTGTGAGGSSAAEGAEAVAPESGGAEGASGSGQQSSAGTGTGQSSESGGGSTPPKAPDAGEPAGAAESDKSHSDHGSGWKTIAEKGVRGAGKSLEKTNETANEFIDPEGAEGQ
ncbi:hypothetical protein ACIGDM_13205 [Rothia koreensis]|uniref:hypothetical protein n=1 Tax=Rothia koreensis TaxID=592378 RepID=UPI0037CACEC8